MSTAALRLQAIPASRQLWLGAGLVLLLGGLIWMSGGSIIPIAAILAVAVAVFVVQDPVRSLFAFIVINVTLTLRPKEIGAEGAASPFDLAMGVCLAGIMAYWLIKLRIFEWQNLSRSVGQLAIAFFMLWSSATTAYAILFGGNSLNIALRELLNLSPLLILPVLYERHVSNNSRQQVLLFTSIICAAVVMILRNLWIVKANASHIIYLYQLHRGSTEATLAGLVVVLSVSLMMVVENWRWRILLALLFLLGWAGAAVSLSRSIYIATFLAMILTLLLGTSRERKRGIVGLLATTVVAIVSLVPFYDKFRILRLMVENYLHRLLTSHQISTDLSLLNRYSEWDAVLANIAHSPVLGCGFGSRFRYFQIIAHFHEWTGFSHNSYLYIAFKSGVLGLVLIVVAFGGFIIKAIKLIRLSSLDIKTKVILRACLAYMALFLIDAYFECSFDSKTDLIWIGLMWGYILMLEQEARSVGVGRQVQL